MNKPQLHVSMLNTLAGCGIAFKRRYGYRFGIWHQEPKTDPSPALITGIAVHKGVEHNLNYMMENDWKSATQASVKEAVERDFAARWSKGVDLQPEEAVIADQTYHTCLEQSIALVMLHYNEIAPALRPIAVEERFVIELTDEPFDLAGTIDVVEANAIHDTKTSKGAIKSARTPQMAMYCTAFKVKQKSLGLPERYPAACTLDVLQKLKTPKARPVTAIPDDKWIRPLFGRIKQAFNVIELAQENPNILTPARDGDWLCTKKFCEFSDTCEFFIPKEEDDIAGK